MEVILNVFVKNLGDFGDVVNVKSGYWRNYLHPRGKAVLFNKNNMEYFNNKQIEVNKKKNDLQNQIKEKISLLNSLNFVIFVRSKFNGKMYDSVDKKRIILELKKNNIIIDKRNLVLLDVIKNIGVYNIKFCFTDDLNTSINLFVKKK